ncbi:MAG TPA: adenylate/guanylate cyclase domain-containing protein [Candidatus Limnocylindrales bacterium]|nr:adenylate/guanylate cyclase domain-containing protein [Candidatus Limnocylindrales bacterium]
MPVTCAVCGAENPEGSRFCNSCGSRLPERVALAEERKVITALFCDLVGFTASSESADPEDVDRMLTRYFAIARRHIETHGGVVEKFIGDAVVGVFGVPQAHEDDPERAVRAALRICDEATSLSAIGSTPLRLRIGINTGEALVRLSISPGTGERFLAGDTVNTASRIQSVAPEMGVAVGQATYEATERRFEYTELPPATLKGKAEPVRVFRPIAPRSRQGIDVHGAASTPFVGRADELRRLTDEFDATVATGRASFATVVGVPGLGKSRLIAELLAHVEAAPVLVTWRQGRCLPYGTGISFWALGEIVKAHAGILESDGAEVAVDKLDRVLGEADDRAWLRERLQPLLGIESGPTAGRDELFAAWRRFLELLTEGRPTVLVFEDLHWADDAMLDFLEDLTTRPSAVPLLAIGTARPEVFETRPTFPGTDGATRIDLQPLRTEDARDLATALLDGIELSDDVREPILDRADGNPLFVSEYIRLLRDRDLLVAGEGRLQLRRGAELPVPDSIQAVLASRIDALPTASKSVLVDASVIGKVFWPGAVASIGGREDSQIATELSLLVARELIRIAPQSSMAGETEYSFSHVLVRDVAYAALPRSGRASRHVSAARWIEERAGDRMEDVADVLAHHYSTALDLARAVGDDQTATELERPALRFLLLAGERALELDVAAALALLERAIELAAPGHPDQAAALRAYGQALNAAGRPTDAVAPLEEAIQVFKATSQDLDAAVVLGRLSSVLRDLGDARGWTYPADAVDLLEPLGPSWELADALVTLGFMESAADRLEESLASLDRAETVAAATPDSPAGRALAFRGSLLGVRGMVRTLLGDQRGIDEMHEAVSIDIATGQANRAGHALNNLAQYEAVSNGPRAGMTVAEEGLAFLTSRGLLGHATYIRQVAIILEYDLGDHDRVLATLPALEAASEAFGYLVALIELRAYGIRVATMRGQLADDATLSWIERAVRDSNEPDDLLGLASMVPAYLLRGDRSEAHDLLIKLAPAMAARVGWNWQPRQITALVRAAVQLADLELAQRMIDTFATKVRYAEHARVASTAALLESRGDLPGAIAAYEDAGRRWAAFGVVPEEAFALLGQGRVLTADGRPADAVQPLSRARSIFGRLRAAPSLREVDELLAGGGVAAR